MADLPENWSYGVCGDGRVFFINDEELRTTWLHPRSGESVNSGHMTRSDLPQGWEEGFTDDGASYLINHNQRITTFRHPVTGRVATDNLDFILQQQPQGVLTMPLPPAGKPGRPSSTTVSESSTTFTSSTVDTNPAAKGSRSSGKVHGFGKRQQSLKRNANVPVAVRGWLYKQDSTGMRLWKRKWFVLADYCLFYYKDSREESVLGSIPLPSYVISHIGPEDHINRKFAFKAEHGGMRTYYFSADTQEDQSGWLRAMNQAAQMKNKAVVRPKENLLSLDPHPAETSDRQETHRALQVLLEPIRPGPSDHTGTLLRDPAPIPMEMDTHSSLVSNLAASSSSHFSPLTDAGPPSAPGSRAPSRAPSALPEPCAHNGLSACTTPSPILEPNGIGAGTYQRNPSPPGPEPAHREPPHREPPHREPPHREHYRGDGRSSVLEQVEQWVQVQRAEVKGAPVPVTLPRVSSSREVRYQTLPRSPGSSPPPATRTGEYKYAQDRLSHFQLAPEPAGPGGAGRPVYQLYEWQQRHQYRHGSPTAALYTPAPHYPYGARPPSTGPSAFSAPRPSDGHPRCISVPPSPADLPPPGVGGTASSPRRPHTPAERVTVRPVGSEVDGPFAASPRRAKSQMFKAATMDRRAGPASAYISHTVSAPSLHGKTTDDAYMQLKKDLEYLDLKVVGSQFLKEVGKPVKVAESDVDVKLSRLCEQDKTLKDFESRISTLKDDKDQLERVLDMSRQQMEQYQEQPGHAHKIAYQQRLLQEDLVTIRASISRLSTEMSGAWQEYVSLESLVEQLRKAMQAHMNHSSTPQQEKTELKRELWRIEDVMAGLSSSKTNYRITIQSVQNPERKLVPSLSEGVLIKPPSCSSPPGLLSLPHGAAEHWVEDGAPPRPPLPSLYDYEDTPPAVPPLPREAVVRHTSVRGLKRQSDERKRDRESGQYPLNGDCKVELRSYLSEPELPVMGRSSAGSDPDTPSSSDKGLFSCGLNQSTSISSYVTLRRGPGGSQAARERPQSALDQMCAVSHGAHAPPCQSRGRMSAEEQLERMKRHQRALVRDRQRNLSQGERPSSSSSPTQRSSSRTSWNQGQEPSPSTPPWEPVHQSGGPPCELGPRRRPDIPPLQGFDPREERPGAEGQSDEGQGTERGSGQSAGWMYPSCVVRETDLEPVDYDLDLSRELSRPPKVPIPERYVESDPDEPQSPEELEKRSHRAQRIRTLLAKSSVHSLQPALGPWLDPTSLDPAPLDFSELDSVLQQQERIMSVSQALASEASRKSKLVADGRPDRLLREQRQTTEG